jgi:F-type H+-transporting ATPase subunit gamma
MSETTTSLTRKIGTASDLQSVVRTMKAMSASSIGQYENAVQSLDDYYRTVQLGLAACFKQSKFAEMKPENNKHQGAIGAVVFGSDQGLVGQFNEVMATFVVSTLDKLPGEKTIWPVGERIHSHLTETKLLLGASFNLPSSVGAISSLVGEILIEAEKRRESGEIDEVYLFYNRHQSGAVSVPKSQRLLPLDDAWARVITAIPWPTKNIPELLNSESSTLLAFVHEYLFVSLFRACAESLASENASRLAVMQRAEKNIDELLKGMHLSFHQLRQSGIDEELFDLISGFEAQAKEKK